GEDDPFTLNAQRAAGGQLHLRHAGTGDGADGAVKLPHHTELSHPAHGVVGPIDQNLAEQRVGTPAGDPLQVGEEIGARVRVDQQGGGVSVAAHDGDEVLEAVIGAAKYPAGEARVPAAQFLRGFFQHQHARPRGPRGQGRGEGGVAGPYDDDIKDFTLSPSHVAVPLSVRLYRYRRSQRTTSLYTPSAHLRANGGTPHISCQRPTNLLRGQPWHETAQRTLVAASLPGNSWWKSGRS